jgi:DHA1 family bicyclomycin/chloramphenicol resistance-like MFS transporter
MTTPKRSRTQTEFIIMLAFMISIVAMATDVMLPALGIIATELAIENANDSHLVVSSLFLGFAVGQLFAGPLSDSFGRKSIVYISYAIFIVGCLMSIFANDFNMLLAGRILQGFGIAGPRIISVAIVRDGYEGRAMARIMSYIMAVFIIVPAIAPAIGQGVIFISGWRATFGLLLGMGIISWVWFGFRQPETLAKDARRKFSVGSIARGVAQIFRNKAAVGYTLATGLVFGPFLGYLSTAQKIFQEIYGTGNYFALYFGAAAIAIGAASFLNSQLVMQMGMQFLTRRAMIGVITPSGLFLIPVFLMGGIPPLWMFMGWLLLTFFGVGVLFGNLNALAMEPLGEMAGLGAALVGAMSTFISLPIGWMISESYSGDVIPLVVAFVVFILAAFLITIWAGSDSEEPLVDAKS